MEASQTAVGNRGLYITEYGIPIRNLWYMLLYAWGELPIKGPGAKQDIENAPTLDALLAIVLSQLVKQRIRIGVGRNYIEEKFELRGIRGRIHFTECVKNRSFEHGKAFCEYQQYSINVPKNQIIRSTLMRLVQTGNFGPDRTQTESIKRVVRRLVRDMEGVDLIELKPATIHRQQLGRNDRDYRLMLAICDLILLRQMPADDTGQSNLPDFDRSALELPKIFERFIANFYRIHLNGWNITSQKLLGWHEKKRSKYLPLMHPDIVLEEKSSGRILMIDTKFTPRSVVENRWGGYGFNSSHLYQIYAYLKTQEHTSEYHLRASGILLYPAINSIHLTESIELQDHTIRIENIDLTASWQEIEQHLIRIIFLE